jgi:hypothetical protein
MEHNHLAKLVQASQAMRSEKHAAFGATTPAETITETSYENLMDQPARDALEHMAKQHQEYDRQLRELEAEPSLTEDEKLEVVRLKKLKLRQKDAIERLRIEMHAYTGRRLEQ